MIQLSNNIGTNRPGLTAPCMILTMIIPAVAKKKNDTLAISLRLAMSLGLRAGISSTSAPENLLPISEL